MFYEESSFIDTCRNGPPANHPFLQRGREGAPGGGRLQNRGVAEFFPRD